MASRLAERLSAVRRRHFVGRAEEVEVFQSALAAQELPFQLLYVFGPGGVGKTTLLNEFASVAARSGVLPIYIDARNVDPAPAPFLNAIRTAAGINLQFHPLEFLAQSAARYVLLVDTFETMKSLEEWLIEDFLPQLPDNVLIVFAGRQPPPPVWRIDPGWQSVVRIIPLRNFHVDESRDYLTRRSVPVEQHQVVLNFTYGHPLALSLVAEVFAQRSDVRFNPEAEPDIVKTLLEQFLQKVPGPAHRAALEACALSRVMTEGLLADMLAAQDAHELFEWLRSLSFIESGQEGLFPHDLAREALVADLRWRNPDWYVQLHHRARSYYAGRLGQASSHEQQRLLFDYVFLHRDNPVMRAIFNWQGVGNALADSARSDDWKALERMVRTYEGEESAAIALRWFQRQPEGVLVLRTPQGAPVGFMMMLELTKLSADDNFDPAVPAALDYLRLHAPLRPGEKATMFRYWMAEETYQSVSPIQSLIFVNVGRYYLVTPGLAFTFFPCADPDFWAPGFSYIDLHRLPETDFTVGRATYGVYGHDWRVVPPMQWLAVLAEREVAGSSSPSPSVGPQSERSIIVLSRDTFADAVSDALRSLHRSDLLCENPLMRSRLLAERIDMNASEDERLIALTEIITQTAESLQTSPRDIKLYRALHRTYLNPAATQERAAELLGLPFSTYRRHLKNGIERLTEMLWHKEIAATKKVDK